MTEKEELDGRDRVLEVFVGVDMAKTEHYAGR